MLRFHVRWVLAASVLSAACGGSTDEEPGTSDDDALFAPGVADPCQKSPNTPYKNNELCLDAPPSDTGFQIHFGPTDYDDPAEMDQYLLAPGDEGVLCQVQTTPNEALSFSNEQHIRIRTGTHHIIYWRQSPGQTVSPPPDGTFAGECRGFGYVFFIGAEAALSEKGGAIDVPMASNGENALAPGDEGIAQRIQPKMSLWIETHFVNTTEETILREAWANVIYTDPEKVTAILDPIFWIGGLTMNVQPQTRVVVPGGPATQAPDVSGQVRLYAMAGHVHAHTERETVFLNHADGGQEIIYQTYDWAEPLMATFDSVRENPALTDEADDGAVSGVLMLAPGDTITWECEVNNTLPNTALRFADRAYDAEMCNVFGYYTPGDGSAWEALTP